MPIELGLVLTGALAGSSLINVTVTIVNNRTKLAGWIYEAIYLHPNYILVTVHNKKIYKAITKFLQNITSSKELRVARQILPLNDDTGTPTDYVVPVLGTYVNVLEHKIDIEISETGYRVWPWAIWDPNDNRWGADIFLAELIEKGNTEGIDHNEIKGLISPGFLKKKL